LNIKLLLKDLKLSQIEFAERIGKAQSTVSAVSIGRAPFPDDWKKIIHREFGITDFSKYETEDISMAAEPVYSGYGISVDGLMMVIKEQAEAIRELTATQARLVEMLGRKNLNNK
jgi:transcriptional regulator with XRE-family HTH domain